MHSGVRDVQDTLHPSVPFVLSITMKISTCIRKDSERMTRYVYKCGLNLLCKVPPFLLTLSFPRCHPVTGYRKWFNCVEQRRTLGWELCSL